MDSPGPDGGLREALGALALAALIIGTVGAPVTAQTGDSPFAIDQEQVDADTVFLSVQLQGDGDARWRVEYRVRLDDANTTAAFEDLEADVERNQSAFVSRFEDRMTTTVEDAASTTGRQMAVLDVGVATTTQQLPQTYGVLAYTFEWTNFAVVDGDQLRAGDALAGFFLDADSALRIAWPGAYSLETVAPEPTERNEASVVWRGPAEFGPDEPAIVVTSGAGDGVNPSLVGLAVVALVLAGGGVLWWWRYRRDAGRGDEARSQPADAGPGDADGPPEELLSNEERVIALLEEHGGRMKQQAVVEELGWTDAKTSQVVGKLRESDEIEGFRLGRENVLRLPEVDESPAPGDVTPDEDEPDG